MTKLNDYLADQLRDKEFQKAYDELGPEYQIIRGLIDGREELNVILKEKKESI